MEEAAEEIVEPTVWNLEEAVEQGEAFEPQPVVQWAVRHHPLAKKELLLIAIRRRSG
jgi:hypothetical protein